ncbi:MAG: GAF domain-containing sensor histidine kinase [Pleurocapsa sp. MO_226.B13]|nr:GAF domain-containing sensor histidine kinase [Pleurocapsa sp. MO_226.B13]
MLDRWFGPKQNPSDTAQLDLNQLMEASRAIMGEIILEKLLLKLLQMTLEMTEATKGAIVLVKQTELEIAVIGTSKPTIKIVQRSEGGAVARSLSVETNNILPLSIINYVVQTQQTILLNSAAQQGNFTTDPYIKENKSKTVLCLPLIGKSNKLLATIYLENNLLVNAFKPKQISILKLIPAGLCIENAQLYKQLENYSDALEDKVQKIKRSEQVSRGQTAVLTNTLNVLTQEPELDKLLETVLSAIAVELNAASSVLWLYDSERDTISHYMSHQSKLSPPSQIYHQASKNPFWQMLITRNDHIYVNVEPEQILEPDFYHWLVEQNLKSLLILPLVLGGKLLGLLSIQSTIAKPLPNEQIELAMALAKQTSLAMQLTNLAAKNKSAAVLEERNRLAREIHDTLAQTFTGISIQTGVAQRLVEREPVEAKNILNRIGELAREGLTEARRSVWALYPETLECNNLPKALSQLVAKMIANTNIKSEIKIQGTPIPLNSQIRLNLLRIAQEALTNILRHAQAENIWLDLVFYPDRLQLRLKDNGRGFNPQLQSNHGGFGLIGMRQRAKQIGSELTIFSQFQQGTEIAIDVPISEPLS